MPHRTDPAGADTGILALAGKGAAMPEPDPTTLDLPPDDATSAGSIATGVGRLRPGDRVDRYVIRDILGEGGFAVVYLAEQTEPVRRKVALKFMKPGMESGPILARFEAERQALAMMDHRCVATVYDAGTTETGQPYFVMEHVPGIPITEHCDRHRLGIDERLSLFVMVCDAVQHAHQKGIIHRDLKPSNILVMISDGQPVPKVIDFGVAKAISQRLTERTVFTEQGLLVGTPEYMSPEQAEMTAQDVDTRSDIYSLGVLLYQMLTGALPFDARTLRKAGLGEIQRIICEEEPAKPSTRMSSLGDDTATSAARRRVDPRSLQRELRGDLDWITMKALEKDRTRRYATASEMAADLARHLVHEPVTASPPSAAYKVRKFVRRHKVGVVAVSLVAASLVAGAAGTSWQAVRATRAERQAFALAESESALRSLAQQRLAEAEAARDAERDQRRLAEQARADAVRQADIARAINEFLEEMLGAANPWSDDPSVDVAREVKVIDLLDAASKTINGKFEADPLVEASIRATLGMTFSGLGEYDAAEPHLAESLRLREAELGQKHDDTLSLMNDLARLYERKGRYDEAERLYLETLETRQHVLGPLHEHTLLSMSNLAMLYVAQGHYQRAEPLLVESLEIMRRDLGREDPLTLSGVTNLAIVHLRQGRFEEAEPLLAETLDVSRRILGDQHPDTVIAMNNLGGLYFEQGRFEESATLFAESLEVQRHVLGDEHPETLAIMSNLATLYSKLDRYDEAEPLMVQTIAVLRRDLGPDHPDVLGSMNNLAWIQLGQGRSEEAEQTLTETIAGLRRSLGDSHPDTLACMCSLATLFRELDRHEEAETLLAEAAEFTRSLPQPHLSTGETVALHGACLMQLGRYEEAEAALREAHPILEARLGGDHARTTIVRGLLANLYELWGKPDEAARWRPVGTGGASR